jgi:hypothetical protein
MKLKKLINYLKMKESQVYTIAEKELSKLDYAMYTDLRKNFLFAVPRRGSSERTVAPVLLVAHMDTVHKTPPKQVFFDEKQGVLWAPSGLGADDRAGVFAALELAKRHRVSVLLTTGEESGGTGARAFVSAYPVNKFGFKMAVQLDRCGENDCVFYSNTSEDFHKYIQEFGFAKTFGSFSDISIIGPAWQLNSVNLSVGYVKEHTASEHLFVDPLINTINKVSKILSQEVPEFEYSERVYSYSRTYKPVNWEDKTGVNRVSWVEDDKWIDTGVNYVASTTNSTTYDGVLEEGLVDCMLCANFVPERELQDVNDNTCYVCKDCFEDDGFECGFCQGLFIKMLSENDEAAQMHICDSCYVSYYLPDAGFIDETDRK